MYNFINCMLSLLAPRSGLATISPQQQSALQFSCTNSEFGGELAAFRTGWGRKEHGDSGTCCRVRKQRISRIMIGQVSRAQEPFCWKELMLAPNRGDQSTERSSDHCGLRHPGPTNAVSPSRYAKERKPANRDSFVTI